MYRRALVLVAIAFGPLTSAAALVSAASGGVTIFDAENCPGHANSPKVTPPFSIGITGLEPFSTDTLMYVTDKDAKPEVTYGPATLRGVDAHGAVCINVLWAPAGKWKIDVVTPGNNGSKSKVFTVEGPPATTTTKPVTTTTKPVTTTTTTAPNSTTTPPTGSTTLPTSTTTTTPPSVSTTAPTSTTLPALTTTTNPSGNPSVPPVRLPITRLPWDFERPEQIGPPPTASTTAPAPGPGSGSLPQTGTSAAAPLGVLAVTMLTLGAFMKSSVRRRRHT